MPLDGIVAKNIVYELNNALTNGRIDKIYQPDRDEIIIAVRAGGKNLKLLLTSNADFPRVHLTQGKQENPHNPPMFCMTLRKHIGNGKITGFFQPALERIIEMKVESLNEMGDISEKRLILEIMGKHSNIILVSSDGKILDCAKKISFDKSSVREVLPGKMYEYPPGQGKSNPLELQKDQFLNLLEKSRCFKLSDTIYKNYCGISPLLASEICSLSEIDSSDFIESVDRSKFFSIFDSFNRIMDDCRSNKFSPEIIYNNKVIVDFSSISLSQFETLNKVKYNSICELLEEYYGKRADFYRLKQKTIDLRKLIQNNIERCVKKRDVLNKTLRDSENMDEWRICGELLTSFMSQVPSGAKFYDALNYYADEENETKRIKLRDDLTPAQNAAKYFEKYNKAKRQKKAVLEQINQNNDELIYLEGLQNIVFTDITESEISEIKEELFEQGYIKKRPVKKGLKPKKSEPLHFVSSDGYHIYVGKNNRQNDELTLKLAGPRDIWLHTKEIPGSHVIIKTEGAEASEASIHDASLLAAFFSKAKDSSNVPVDYTQRRNVKKPSGAKPGMVIYERNRTIYVTPLPEEVDSIKQL